MKKKVLGVFAVLSLATSVGFAAPLNDFSEGKVAIDISARPSNDIKADNDTTLDAKTSWEYGITAGVGNNFAVQYKNFNPKSKDYSGDNLKLETQELNVLYKLNENYTVFTGLVQAKSKYNLSGLGGLEGDTKSNWQVGVTGQSPLADKLTGYATVAAGADTSSWKLGLAYAVNKNTDFDLFYAENKYNKVNFYGGLDLDADYKVKGLGYGVTYKF